MRAGLPKREPALLERWRRIGLHGRQREVAKGRPLHVLHDGPPYANGHLHIGHAVNKILKDMVVRSQQMMGRDSRYIPGWDCHGLPIEWKVEEAYVKEGRSKDEVPVLELRAACREFAEGWIGVQSDEFQRLGVGGDWEQPYTTMAYGAEAAIVAEFHRFVMNGSLYRGSKPVMWSSVERTALAEAEIEYHDRVSPALTVRFPIVEGPLAGAAAAIWTTTPWTIPANRAIAYSPSVSYGVWRVEAAGEGCRLAAGDRLVLADERAEGTLGHAGVASHVREGEAAGLEQSVCAHPLRGIAGGCWENPVPVLAGDFVSAETGTGLVHMAPSHGEEDYELALSHGLELTHYIDGDGRYVEDLPLFGGERIYREDGKEDGANRAVIARLEEAGAVVALGKQRHSYPHSWRSKAPLIYRNTPQWFIAVDRPLGDGQDEDGATIRERALASIDRRVRWYPESGRNRLRAMVADRPDWVVSRQRAWGVPLACFVERATGEPLRDEKVNAAIVEAFRAEGADAWFAEDAAGRFLGEGRDPEEFEKIDDILDVWFESGSTHAFVLEGSGEETWPADLYLEGTDQHRGWFHSSLLESCGSRGRAPYRAVLTHGFALDEAGEKMSKSRGNVVAPQDVIDRHGADILRLWTASADTSQDMRIGPGILQSASESYRRFRNGLRFLLGNLNGWDETERVEPKDMPMLERWALHRLAQIDPLQRESYGGFAFQKAFSALFNFCTNDLSSFYFDIRKDSLYCDRADSMRRRACRTVLDELFRRVACWASPVLCFTAEEAWLERYGDGDSVSVHLETFPYTPESWLDPELDAEMARWRALRRVVTGALEIARRESGLGSSLEAAPVLYLGAEHEAPEAEMFAEMCIVSALRVERAEGPEDAFRLEDVPGAAVVVERAGGHRCARCWRVLEEVAEADGLCRRCEDAVKS